MAYPNISDILLINMMRGKLFKYWKCSECIYAAEADREVMTNACLIVDALIDGEEWEYLAKHDCPYFSPTKIFLSELGNEREDVFWVK